MADIWRSMVPVASRKRSARVDLPWSMWAMMQKLRMGLVARSQRTGLACTGKLTADGQMGRRLGMVGGEFVWQKCVVGRWWAGVGVVNGGLGPTHKRRPGAGGVCLAEMGTRRSACGHA